MSVHEKFVADLETIPTTVANLLFEFILTYKPGIPVYTRKLGELLEEYRSSRDTSVITDISEILKNIRYAMKTAFKKWKVVKKLTMYTLGKKHVLVFRNINRRWVILINSRQDLVVESLQDSKPQVLVSRDNIYIDGKKIE